MAAPSFVAASTGGTDASGAWTATCHAPAQAGNLIVLQFLQDGASGSPPTVTSVTNIETLDGTDGNMENLNGSGSQLVGGTGEARQHLYVGRSLSTSAPVVTGANVGGDDVYYRFYEFTNVNTGTTVADIIENGAGLRLNEAGTSNTASDTSVTTNGPDRLALNFVAVNDDNAISAFTGETGGDWTLATAPYADAGGTDGAIGLQASYGLALETLASPASGGPFGHTTFHKQAQSFVAPSTGTTDSVWVSIDPGAGSGSPADSARVSIYSDSGGSPNASLGSATFSGLTKQIVRVPLAVSLTATTTYWIVLDRTGADSATDYYGFGGTSVAGTRKYWTGAAWSADLAGDAAIGIQMSSQASGFTIDGGTGSIVDIDAWGVVGFALIGTTVASTGSLLLQNLSTRIIRRPYVTR